jgi:hypothetical protein
MLAWLLLTARARVFAAVPAVAAAATWFDDTGNPTTASPDQLVAIPGSPASHLYFLTRGFADVYMNDLLIDTLVPGDSFCEAVSDALRRQVQTT